MSNVEVLLTEFQKKLAAVKGSARFRLAESIPGVREGVELVVLAEQLLVGIVNELRARRDGGGQ